uniref:RSE1/DDB1/CPSF1 second beta-propeller domain-containing protein n=1 Tax=Vitis vinifera TaxID=29760 RepID=A5AHM9_VITVI|nr:hypothetical protein VITISV_017053 [Vitis vinifera]
MKILRSLPSQWHTKVTTIQEAKDLTKLPLEELIGSLMTYEINLVKKQKECENKKKKCIVLKATTKEEEEEEEVEEDEDLALITRKFNKFMRGEKFRGRRFTSRRDLSKKKSSSHGDKERWEEKRDLVCFKCKKSEHIKYDRPLYKSKAKKRKKKAIMTTWSESEEFFKEENEKEVANMYFMTIDELDKVWKAPWKDCKLKIEDNKKKLERIPRKKDHHWHYLHLNKSRIGGFLGEKNRGNEEEQLQPRLSSNYAACYSLLCSGFIPIDSEVAMGKMIFVFVCLGDLARCRELYEKPDVQSRNWLSNPQAEFEDTEGIWIGLHRRELFTLMALDQHMLLPLLAAGAGITLVDSVVMPGPSTLLCPAVHELKRVLVIDFDVHHGDGTNDDSMMAQTYSSFPLIKMEATLVLVKLTSERGNNGDGDLCHDKGFEVNDSLINVGPLKVFAYALRINADLKATGIVKQSNFELMCCSGHGKNGALCILQQSIRPEMITEVELSGCERIWTVYHKNTRGHNADSTKMVTKDDEYCAYLIISPESRTMVLETVELLGENDFALSVAMDLVASVSAIEQTSKAASVSFMRKFLYKISGQESAIMGILKMLRSLECAV